MAHPGIDPGFSVRPVIPEGREKPSKLVMAIIKTRGIDIERRIIMALKSEHRSHIVHQFRTTNLRDLGTRMGEMGKLPMEAGLTVFLLQY